MDKKEKIKERALLMERFCWYDKIYGIGRELDLPSFKPMEGLLSKAIPIYWNYSKEALEISEVINDGDLLKFVKKYPPEYELGLGGFHGKYYTATEKAEVAIKGSWDEIKKNSKKAFDRWGEKVYGILQAIINKNGESAYFDIIDEIENVLGYSYIPSYILPRLRTLKLVFKTGSNKYPSWTIPPEIIPLLQEELKIYLESDKKTKYVKEKVSEKDGINEVVLHSSHNLDKITEGIVQKRREVNIVFEYNFGINLFKSNELAISDIRKLCDDEDAFNNRIQSLTNLIDEINIKDESTKGSINILEKFLEANLSKHNKSIILNFRNIMALRSNKYPIHSDKPKFMVALNFFGLIYPPDWEDLWEIVLKKYYESLNLLKEAIDMK
ncbi:MAG: hypothetical protein DRP06_00135 [Candidatus Aenigmatarchaeota archaeon]|nr:MAG: hypothetical protein DRP06_00135 [Candidatus Aenigmarchaeota archaeon]